MPMDILLRYIKRLSIFFLTIMVMVGCAAPSPEKKKIDLVWPLPPAEPKIRFIDIIKGAPDFARKPGIIGALFGEERVETFDKPYGVATDKLGRVYVTDTGRVWILNLKDSSFRFIGHEQGDGRLKRPVGITVSSDGRLFVADSSLKRVFVYLEDKFVAAIGHEKEFTSPVSVAVDEKRQLMYISDPGKHTVNVYSLKDYTMLRTIGKRGEAMGQFNFPTSLTVDSEGRLYVVDSGNFRVQVFDHEGEFIKFIGEIGDTPGSFARPKGIALDSEGHIYVIDAAFQNFQIFDFEGNILLHVGSGGTEPGQFLLPAGIAVDDEDRIYVVNQIPPSLQIFEYLGDKWKKRETTGR